MTKAAKITLGIVIAVLVVGGIAWWYSMNQANPTAMNQTATSTTQTQTASGGSSNADLNADLSTADNQMSGFNSDSASINQGLNDQPVQQQQL